MKKTVLITGASSGIGLATARLLSKDYRLILCGRNKERLHELYKELETKTEVIVLLFDVSDKEEVFNQINHLPDEWKTIDILINNAGNAHGLAAFQEADVIDLETMIDTNVKGVIYVTKAVLPYMIAQKSGYIINVSSIAGKEVYSLGTTYCASKSAVEALSKGMRMDLLPLGIKVSNVAPGAVETGFSNVRFKGDDARADAVYAGFEPLTAEDIAASIYYILSQPEHVQVSDITILPKAQSSAASILRNL